MAGDLVQQAPEGAPAEELEYAEVEEVWPRDGHIRVVGRIPGAASDASAVLVARGRERADAEVRVETRLRCGRFDARLALHDLASPCTAAELTWDLYLAWPDEELPRRLGRHLDDIDGKKKIFIYPGQLCGPVRVEPYYTVKDNLSVVCRRGGA